MRGSMAKKEEQGRATRSEIRRGDKVMVISGGNSTTRPLKGQVGTVQRFVGRARDRVILEGLNLVTRHQRAAGPGKAAGKVQREAGIHISNVMFYAEKIKRPVRLGHQILADGTRVRGYRDPSTKEFVQIESK